MPLPTPLRPWLHLALNFIMDLPQSEGMTTILLVLDRFSRALRLIPLLKLLTAFKVFKLVFQQVYRYFGISEDIVNDRAAVHLTDMEWIFDESNIGLSPPIQQSCSDFYSNYMVSEHYNFHNPLHDLGRDLSRSNSLDY